MGLHPEQNVVDDLWGRHERLAGRFALVTWLWGRSIRAVHPIFMLGCPVNANVPHD